MAFLVSVYHNHNNSHYCRRPYDLQGFQIYFSATFKIPALKRWSLMAPSPVFRFLPLHLLRFLYPPHFRLYLPCPCILLWVDSCSNLLSLINFEFSKRNTTFWLNLLNTLFYSCSEVPFSNSFLSDHSLKYISGFSIYKEKSKHPLIVLIFPLSLPFLFSFLLNIRPDYLPCEISPVRILPLEYSQEFSFPQILPLFPSLSKL